MDEEVYKNLELQFPFAVRDAVQIKQYDDWELVVTLKNGDRVLYDDFSKTLRNLPKDSNSLTEEECRREFGDRLRKLMFRRGVSQDELSVMTGITRAMISRYITGRSTCSFYNADKIAKALGCSVDIFRYVD